MAVHPSGRFLYACRRDGGVAAWSLTASGDLAARTSGTQDAGMGELHAIEMAPDGKSLMGINRGRGLIQQAEIDSATGRLMPAAVVARLDSPSSLTMIYS